MHVAETRAHPSSVTQRAPAEHSVNRAVDPTRTNSCILLGETVPEVACVCVCVCVRACVCDWFPVLHTCARGQILPTQKTIEHSHDTV